MKTIQIRADDIGLAYITDADLSAWIRWNTGQDGDMIHDPTKTVMLLELLTRRPAPNENMIHLTLMTDFAEARPYVMMRYQSHATSLERRVAEIFAMVRGWGKCCEKCVSGY